MNEELFFVGIKEPTEIRKELLTASKNIINTLKKYETYKLTKDQKAKQIQTLKRVIDEILVLNKKLKGKLPQVPIKAPQTTREQPKQHKITPGKLERLEDELSKIEERLRHVE